MAWYCISPAIFQFLQRQTYPSYHETPTKNHFELIGAIDLQQNKRGLAIFRLALGSVTLNGEMLIVTDSFGCTVLPWIAYAISSRTYELKHRRISQQADTYLLRHRPCRYSNYCGWSTLLQNVLSAGSFVHAVDSIGRTPLCSIVDWYGRSRSSLSPDLKRNYYTSTACYLDVYTIETVLVLINNSTGIWRPVWDSKTKRIQAGQIAEIARVLNHLEDST